MTESTRLRWSISFVEVAIDVTGRRDDGRGDGTAGKGEAGRAESLEEGTGEVSWSSSDER